jgi:hypothetical protein
MWLTRRRKKKKKGFGSKKDKWDDPVETIHDTRFQPVRAVAARL